VAGEPSIVDLVDASPAAGRAANRAGLLYASAVLARDPVALAAADRVLPEPSWWRRLLRLIAWEAAVDGGWGDPVPALRVDLEAFTASGDEHFARTARDLLRRAGAPTRRGRGTATVPDRLRAAGVTSREMDVLRLVAAGLSNKEIAERLFLSPRTVETHVARLLAKTGTATRNGLGALSP
jgi:DNA-binding CsgD family transcriptional regulator